MLFWSIFSRIWTEYGKILRISLYSVRMLENTDQNNSEHGHFSRSVADSFMLKTFVSSAKILHIEVNSLLDHLCKSKIILVLILILVELQNLLFSTQMFVHLKQLFVHDSEDSFQVKKVVHLQYHMLLT